MVCGLGNPGPRYEHTRHNVGFAVIERIADAASIRFGKKLWRPYRFGCAEQPEGNISLVEPLTYMNLSGTVLPRIMSKTGLTHENLVVICDTLDLAPGKSRLKRKGSSAGHRGLKSIIDTVGSGDFLRFYIGIGRPAEKADVKEYVLEIPTDDEAQLVEACIDRTVTAILALAREPVERVMDSYNAQNHA